MSRPQFRNRRAVRQRTLQQLRFGKAIAEPLFKLLLFAICGATHRVSQSGRRVHCLRERKRERAIAHFGALSCVEFAFFAVSMPALQFACSELWIAAHFVNAAAAASKCDAFSFANPSKYKLTGSGSECVSVFSDCSSVGIAWSYCPFCK